MIETTANLQPNPDTVVKFFESCYFARNEATKERLFEAYLRSSSVNRAWIARTLVDGVPRIRISPNKLKESLFERIDPWQWEESMKYLNDASEVLVRLWPGCAGVLHKEVDWWGIDEHLQGVDACGIESAIADLLDRMDEAQRWLWGQLYLKRTDWGIRRRTVFEVLRQIAGVRNDPEAYWYELSQNREKLHRLLAGTLDLEALDPGCCFIPFEPIQSLVKAEAEAFLAGSYAKIYYPEGVLVQLQVRGNQKALFDQFGNLLNSGFSDLLDGFVEPLCCVGIVSPAPSANQDETIRKRLRWIGRQPLKPLWSSVPVNFHMLAVLNDHHSESCSDCEDPRWKPVFPPEVSQYGSDCIFVRKPNQSAINGPIWFRIKKSTKRAFVILLYGEREFRGQGISSYTVGLPDKNGQWIPLVKLPSESVGSLDGIRLEDWTRSHIAYKKGPILEFDKTLVWEIEWNGVKPAPRRKCGIELEGGVLKRIAWEKNDETVGSVEHFVNNCEEM